MLRITVESAGVDPAAFPALVEAALGRVRPLIESGAASVHAAHDGVEVFYRREPDLPGLPQPEAVVDSLCRRLDQCVLDLGLALRRVLQDEADDVYHEVAADSVVNQVDWLLDRGLSEQDIYEAVAAGEFHPEDN
jgi:hypothetical protein